MLKVEKKPEIVTWVEDSGDRALLIRKEVCNRVG